MSGSRRGKFLVTGAAIAAVGFLFPDLYEITYAPWAPTKIPASQLHGIVGDFNGYNGPYHGWAILGSILYLGVLGLLVPHLGFDQAKNLLDPAKKVMRLTALGSGTVAGLFAIISFFWQFNGSALPKDATKVFIARQGGGATAIAESHYLSASLGACVFLLIGGLLIALGGFWPKTGGILAGVAGILVLLLCAGVNIGIPIPGVTETQTIPAADGSQPRTATVCVLEPGKDENCESPGSTVTIVLPNPSPTVKGCAYAITATWGDHSAVQSAVVHPTGTGTLYTVRHTYPSESNAYALTITEKVTAGACVAKPAIWKPQFAIAIRVHP